DAQILIQTLVVARDLLVEVRDERVGDGAQAALDPFLVRVLRVGRAPQHHRAQFFEFLVTVRELRDLGRADEGEVGRVEEQHDPLAAVVRQRNLDEFAVTGDGVFGEVWCFLPYEICHGPALGRAGLKLSRPPKRARTRHHEPALARCREAAVIYSRNRSPHAPSRQAAQPLDAPCGTVAWAAGGDLVPGTWPRDPD